MTRQPQSQYLKRKNNRESWTSVIGIVTKVFQHDGTESEFSNHEVNVQLTHRSEEFKRLPVHADHEGSIYVPQEDDVVEVGFLQSKTQRPYVANVVYTDETRPPLARAGQFRRKFGPDEGLGDNNEYLFFEAEKKNHERGDPNVLRMASKTDGLSNPSMAIEVDESGEDTIAEIRKNGDPDSDQYSDLSVGIDEADDPEPSAYVAADTNDDGSREDYVDVREDGKITIHAEDNQDVVVEHEGLGDINVSHTGMGGISVTNSGQGGISISEASQGSLSLSNATAGNTTIIDDIGDVTVQSATGDAQLNGSTVTLGAGGQGVILDVTVNTQKDGDGHVTDVSLDISRSSVVSTE